MTTLQQLQLERQIGYKEGYADGLADNKAIEIAYDSGCKDGRKDFITKIKQIPTTFPDIESDSFDAGYKQCKSDILALIN